MFAVYISYKNVNLNNIGDESCSLFQMGKTNITENPFAIENEDYEVLRTNAENPKGGRPTQDFKLTANFAKKLSMQGKTERAEQAREYFIRVEDKIKKVVFVCRI